MLRPPWDGDVSNLYKHVPPAGGLPYVSNLTAVSQTVRAVRMDIRRKTVPLMSNLSRSSELTRIGYDFLLTFHTNRGPISYRFQDIVS